MKNYPLNGTMGMVIGSLSPWVEVITQEYKKIISKHPKIGYLHPIELLAILFKNFRYQGQFGFVASFSSIEHSGLGRYGDALDPIGDFRELQKVRCLLKDGGYAFIGIPSGADGIMFNAHRIYGRARLPLLFDGKLISLFNRSVKIAYFAC
uniref:Methyltransferase n=1 Tax=Syphacia muris TaxID=451379 RepID=A0A0N5ACQ4_9BILA